MIRVGQLIKDCCWITSCSSTSPTSPPIPASLDKGTPLPALAQNTAGIGIVRDGIWFIISVKLVWWNGIVCLAEVLFVHLTPSVLSWCVHNTKYFFALETTILSSLCTDFIRQRLRVLLDCGSPWIHILHINMVCSVAHTWYVSSLFLLREETSVALPGLFHYFSLLKGFILGGVFPYLNWGSKDRTLYRL